MDKFINHDHIGKRVKYLDSRFYQAPGSDNFYPGVTTILNAISKGKQYETWLKSNGFNAEILAERAMTQGSNVHDGIQRYCMGEEITWANPDGFPQFTKNEWLMVSRFADFVIAFRPKIRAVECIFVSEKLGFGSQLDLVCELQNELWLIDHKTGSLYSSAGMQLAALRELWNEFHPDEPIQKCGIMHLDSAHRGRDKQGKKMQGVGWQLVEQDNIDGEWSDFKAVHQIWKRLNPNYKPANLILPDRYSIKDLKEFELPKEL